jgi:PAS domain S-box-containing protein
LLAVGPEKHPADLPEWFAAGVDDYLVACRDTPRLEERLAAAQRRLAAPVAESAGEASPVGLRAQEELLALYDRMSDAILIADVETRRFLRVNPAACRLLGYNEAELLRMDVESIHPPADLPRIRTAFEEGARDRLTQVSNFRCLHKDGSIVDVDIASTRMICRGRPCIVGFFRDITERNRATEALRVQRDLGVALSSTSDLATALDAILQAACRISGVDCGGVYLVDEHGDLHLAACSGVSPEFAAAVRHFGAASPETQLMHEEQPIYDDHRGVARGTQEARLAEGLRSLAVLPVKHEGHLIAVLNVASRTRDEIPVSTRQTLETLAGRLGGVITRLRIAEALDKSERRYERLVSTITDAIMVIDVETRCLVGVNRACESLYGYTQEEFLQLHLRDISAEPAESETSVEETLAGRLDRVPLRYHRKRDGTVFPVEISTSTYVQDGRRVLCGVIRDITERLRAEAALRESEQKFQTFVRHSPYGYVETDIEGNIEYVNQRVADIFGYAPEEPIGVHFSRFLDVSEVRQALANLAALGRGVVAEPHEYMGRRKDGGACFVELTSLPRRNDGRVVGYQSTMLDITPRKLAEQALREHDTMLRTLFENLPDFVVMVDRNATLQFVNHGDPTATADEVLGKVGFSFLAPESQAAAQECFARTIATREVQSVEVLDINGVCWACRLVPMLEGGEVQSVMVICTDVSQQKKALDAVAKEQQLLRQLLDLHERDRQVMAYEIHDGFAQQLTAAMYGFQAFQRLREEMPEKAVSSFESGMKLLSGSIDEARRLIGGLRPPILDEFGIVAAVEYLIHDCHTRGGPQVEFDYDVSFERLAPPLESALFRIVQEGLTNVCRHSQSAKARIGLSQAGDRIRIDVRDWGVGFDPARVQEGRFGLQGIRERARLLGGRVVITTAPNQGTHIFVELPLIEAPPTDAR